MPYEDLSGLTDQEVAARMGEKAGEESDISQRQAEYSRTLWGSIGQAVDQALRGNFKGAAETLTPTEMDFDPNPKKR